MDRLRNNYNFMLILLFHPVSKVIELPTVLSCKLQQNSCTYLDFTVMSWIFT